MGFRKLRIAWSVFWGLACVLLIGLWVRSYWRNDHIVWNGQKKAFDVSFERGRISTAAVDGRIFLPDGWSRASFSVSGEESESSDEPKTVFGFGWGPHGDLTTVYVIPLWFPVLVSAVTAILPPPLLKRFSLRTLLIATTLVAALLGAIVYATR